ncbi:hypothetical protein T484DRAFT_1982225 [Baffinella frigidus]|nr:hypothetical protein T484DRAFT_1982225 [Cryptophyta sp. CCMP2293]
MCLRMSPSLSDAAIVEESCAASNASTVSQEDVPTWVDVSERKPPTATFALPKRLWQPDAEALTCSLTACGKEFHSFVRRHHCRVCGRVVCADCSKGRRRLLPETGSGTGKALDARACDVCNHAADLYPMPRTISSHPPRSGTMRAPTHATSVVTSEWGHALHLPVTSLSAPLAIPNARPDWLPLPDAAKELPSDGRARAERAERAEDGAQEDATGVREEQDHDLQALRHKFAKTFHYEGLLLHEPAALDLLMRLASDQLRSRDM